MNKKSFPIFCILIFIAVFLDWQKWSIGETTTDLLINYVQILVIISLIVALSWAIVNLVRRWKSYKLQAILPTIIMIFVISSFTFLPITELGIKVNYVLNQPSRDNVIELLNQGKLQQTDINEFVLPFNHRLSSHTGRILVHSNKPYTNNPDKVLFYIHCGSKVSSAIIYSADDSKITDGDFGRYYRSINKIKPKWYLVTMTW